MFQLWTIGRSAKPYALAILFALLLASCWGKAYQSPADQARLALDEGRYNDAILLYEQHIGLRLNAKHRMEEENPYFYYLLIGDAYLKLDDPELALEAYTKAWEQEVSPVLVVDRCRQLADWYGEKLKFEVGIDILRHCRELDPLSIDQSIDQLHRAQVAHEMRSPAAVLPGVETDTEKFNSLK